MSKILKTVLIVIGLVIFSGVVFLGYKFVILSRYYVLPSKDMENIKRGLTLGEMNIYKKILSNDRYLVEDDFKIRNDFKDYKRSVFSENPKVVIFEKVNEDKKKVEFTYSIMPPLVDIFSSDDIDFYSDDNTGKYFLSLDRKKFLERNGINDDIDFFRYIKNNYYKKNTLWMSKREMMDNFTLNLFVQTVIPTFLDSTTIILGDYKGYMYSIDNYKEVSIIKNGQRYIFSFKGSGISDIEYIKDVISTLEIN